LIKFSEFTDPMYWEISNAAALITKMGYDPYDVIDLAAESLVEESMLDGISNWWSDLWKGKDAARAGREASIAGDHEKAMEALMTLKNKLSQNRGAELPLIGVIMQSVQRSIKALAVSRGDVYKADELMRHYASASSLSGSRRAMMPTADWSGLKRMSDDPREWDQWYKTLKDNDPRKRLIDREAHDRADREIKDKDKWEGLFKRNGVEAPDQITSDRWYVMDRLRRSVR